jgi:DNA-binding transcriptional ArsR family regulator
MITFVLPTHALERVAFAYAPLVEAFFSLDVVNEPKHHPLHHGWVRRFRRLDAALKREVAFFSYYYNPYIPSPIATYPTGHYASFDSDVERLLALDDETLRYEFTAPFAGQTAISHGYSPDDERWRAVALERAGLEIRVDRAAQRFSFERSHEHVVEIGLSDQLVLNPSYYLWPHVRVNCEAPWPYAVAYPTPFSRRRARLDLPPTELVRPLKALAHDLRLEIVRLVAERPRSTQELAPLLRLSESAVSKHLRQLSDAHILSSAREGYYVLYRLEHERLDSIASALRAFVLGGDRRSS